MLLNYKITNESKHSASAPRTQPRAIWKRAIINRKWRCRCHSAHTVRLHGKLWNLRQTNRERRTWFTSRSVVVAVVVDDGVFVLMIIMLMPKPMRGTSPVLAAGIAVFLEWRLRTILAYVEASMACTVHHLSFGAFLLRSYRLVIRPIHSEPFLFFYILLVSFASIRFQRCIGIFAALAKHHGAISTPWKWKAAKELEDTWKLLLWILYTLKRMWN